MQTINQAKKNNFTVTLIFFWLNSVELAKQRIALRVKSGGHFIPDETIERRYYAGLKNLFELYLDACDNVLIFDNSVAPPKLIMKKIEDNVLEILDAKTFKKIRNDN